MSPTPTGPVAVFRESLAPRGQIDVPYLLDFYPLQSEEHTRIHPFFKHLREGRFTTTRCKACGELLWQPRAVCSKCLSEDLEWVELPTEGTVYAFTAMVRGPPLGMEADIPFVIALVDLDTQWRPLRLLTRIDGVQAGEMRIGDKVRLKIINLADGRVFYRFTGQAGNAGQGTKR
ncbi:MAG: Zn-ribbon domain-containing OB-fold protein [Euryarchaeota archaeon]|nr:Zn-ribbon domain-containing OB-fold protein [Euryarchaeota archaeon]